MTAVAVGAPKARRPVADTADTTTAFFRRSVFHERFAHGVPGYFLPDTKQPEAPSKSPYVHYIVLCLIHVLLSRASPVLPKHSASATALVPEAQVPAGQARYREDTLRAAGIHRHDRHR